MKTSGLKKNLIILGILLFSLFVGLSTAPAEDKTPPYTGWKPADPFQPYKKTSPQPAKTPIKAAVTIEKPVEAQPVERPPDTGDYQPEEYVVQEGDWIAKILRKKGALKENNLPKLLEILRKFNESIKDFNVIRPGEKIMILVRVTPEEKAESPAPKEKQAPLRISTPAPSRKKTESVVRELKSESYRIKRGDTLIRVVVNRYDLSAGTFVAEYLDLFKKCNPSIKNPDRVFPGQTINLPLYPPQWHESPASPPVQPPIMRDLARSNKVWLPDPEPIKPVNPSVSPTVAALSKPRAEQKSWVSDKAARPEEPKRPETPVRPQTSPAPTEQPERAPLPAPASPETSFSTSSWQTRQTTTAVADGLGDILPQMGEKWIHSGEHFIPMKSGGHINLKADTYPIVKLHGGMTLIVDLYNSLPPRMGRVIESSWGTYRIVHLSPGDDLKSAFTKILKAIQYPKVFKKGKPLKLSGTIPVSITGDWIVIPPRGQTGKDPGFIVINLSDDKSQAVPQSVKAYLKRRGVLFVEYPSAPTPEKPLAEKAPETTLDAPSLVEMILTLTGHPYDARVKIPAFESRNDDFKLTVTADFYLTTHGKERVIDLSGLDPEIVALLKERGVSVLSLSKEKNPLAMASKTLKFLGWQYKMGPHTLSTAPHSKKNVKLTLSGLIFF
ncbi:MAG: LysM peptidoglycan-binding domain-containing protein, partial [Deltaproteobacteria bacterium]|nr:LysM peptidoglycan-binding domain-containing protein [Deltaproteobacteria bacterium]